MPYPSFNCQKCGTPLVAQNMQTDPSGSMYYQCKERGCGAKNKIIRLSSPEGAPAKFGLAGLIDG